MRGMLQRARVRFPRNLAIWIGITVLLAIAVLSAIADLARVPITETRRANQAQQRVIIDPVTGIVSGLNTANKAQPFDVESTSQEPPAAAPESTPPADEAPASEPMVDERTPGTAVPVAAASSYEPLQRHPTANTAPKVAHSAQSLVGAPAPEITETADGVAIPMRGKNDARPAMLYARPFNRKEDQALLSILVTDVGFSDESLQLLLDLPPQISVAISPYANDSAAQISSLRNAGHEVWGMLPSVSARYPQTDPGPLGLIPSITPHEATKRLYRILAATIGSVGMVLAPDETLSAQKKLWPDTLSEIDGRGLYLLSTHPSRSLDQLSHDKAVQNHMHRADVTLDSTPGIAFIRSKLAGLKDAAQSQKQLVVLLSARPQALRTLAQWLKENPLGEDVTLAPLSAIYVPFAPPVAAKAEAGHGEEKSGH